MLNDNWRLGLAVRTPGLFIANRVSEACTTVGAFDPGSSEGTSAAYLSEREEAALGVEVLEPLRLRLGLVHRWKALELALDGDLQTGRSNEALSLTHAPIWNARVGARYAFNERLSAGLGFFTDRSVGSAREGLDLDFYGVAGGLHYVKVGRLAATESQDRLSFSTTLGLRYAYGSGEAEGLAVPETIARGSALDPRTVGASAHELTLHVGSAAPPHRRR